MNYDRPGHFHPANLSIFNNNSKILSHCSALNIVCTLLWYLVNYKTPQMDSGSWNLQLSWIILRVYSAVRLSPCFNFQSYKRLAGVEACTSELKLDLKTGVLSAHWVGLSMGLHPIWRWLPLDKVLQEVMAPEKYPFNAILSHTEGLLCFILFMKNKGILGGKTEIPSF